jgi:hypothetical protein
MEATLHRPVQSGEAAVCPRGLVLGGSLMRSGFGQLDIVAVKLATVTAEVGIVLKLTVPLTLAFVPNVSLELIANALFEKVRIVTIEPPETALSSASPSTRSGPIVSILILLLPERVPGLAKPPNEPGSV